MTTPSPTLEAIRVTGGIVFLALILSTFLAWHWINMRFEAQRAELAGKVECFDALREKLSEPAPGDPLR